MEFGERKKGNCLEKIFHHSEDHNFATEQYEISDNVQGNMLLGLGGDEKGLEQTNARRTAVFVLVFLFVCFLGYH